MDIAVPGAHSDAVKVARGSDPGTSLEGPVMSIHRVAARPARSADPRPQGGVISPILGRAVQGLAVTGACTLGIAITLILPGTARGAEPPPAGVADAYTASHDGVLSVDAASGVLINDTGSGLVAELWTDPDDGDLLLASDGGFVYTQTSVSRSDSFQYRASDPDGLTTEPVRVTIHVANKPPVCDVAQVTGSLANEPVELDLSAFCTDPDGDPLSYTYQAPDVPAGAVWEADALGHVRFLPTLDWTGLATVVFMAADGRSTSMPSALTIEVDPAE